MGHQCRKQLLQMDDLEVEAEEEAMNAEEVEDTSNRESEEDGGEISLHIIEGCPSKKIIKVKGLVGKKKVVVLINSGSTQLPKQGHYPQLAV